MREPRWDISVPVKNEDLARRQILRCRKKYHWPHTSLRAWVSSASHAIPGDTHSQRGRCTARWCVSWQPGQGQDDTYQNDRDDEDITFSRCGTTWPDETPRRFISSNSIRLSNDASLSKRHQLNSSIPTNSTSAKHRHFKTWKANLPIKTRNEASCDGLSLFPYHDALALGARACHRDPWVLTMVTSKRFPPME